MKSIFRARIYKQKGSLALCWAVWVYFALSRMLFAQGYTMVPIARPNDPTPDGRLFFSASYPSVSDQGQVAFVGCVDRFACDMYLYDQGQIVPIAQRGNLTDRCGTLALFGPPSLNDWGQIAFSGGLTQPGADGLFLFDGNQLVTLVCPGDAAPEGGLFRQAFTPSLNNSGQVAFLGILSNSQHAVFFYDGTQIRRIIGSGDRMPDGGILQRPIDPVLNDQGQIVFKGLFPDRSGVFLFDQGEIRKIVQSGDPAPDGGVLGSIFYLALNALGQVVFSAVQRDPFVEGIFLFDEGEIRRIVPFRDPDTGNMIIGSGRLAINRLSEVAFHGVRLREGLFLFDGERFITIVRSGDPMPDNGPAFNGFASFSLNSVRQVAFTAFYPRLGESGVFLALPNR